MFITVAYQSSHGKACRADRRLDLGNRYVPGVEDAGGENRIGTHPDSVHEMLGCSGSSACDNRNRGDLADRAQHPQVEAASRAVGIHRVDDDFAGAQPLPLLYPLQQVQAGVAPPAMTGDLETTGRVRGAPAADRKRNEDLVAGVLDEVDHATPGLGTCGDVVEHELVDELRVVLSRQLERVAHVYVALELDALRDFTVVNVEAGHDSHCYGH